ncbi:DUF805 domain-containing protein [Veillonella sp. CHU732]|uniref:DUF805 domain-containing protein n=1 Tax=Veillonella sp. CHU732 TaxID=2490949 RepID=UPI000F8E2F98|nr:DUF805 domain-containing protein [Veillonella sp. CHU732]
MFCKKCGNKIVEGAKFCRYCGCEVGQKGRSDNEKTEQKSVPQFQQNNVEKEFTVEQALPNAAEVNQITAHQSLPLQIQQVSISKANFSVLSDFKREFLERYFNFKGRTSRRAFLGYCLIQMLISTAIIAIVYLVIVKMNSIEAILYGSGILFSSALLTNFIFLIPNVATTVRRLHDIGKSGWWYLLIGIPFINLYVVYLLLLSGNKGENIYGPTEQFDCSLEAEISESQSRYKKEAAIIGVLCILFLGIIIKSASDMTDSINGDTTKSTATATTSKQVGREGGTSKTQEQPVDPNVQIANEAKNALLAYHQAISNRDISKAYYLMTPERQHELGGLDNMRRGYSTTISSTVVDAKPSHVEPNKVVFQYKLNAKDSINGRIKIQTFTGDVTMVKNNGQWYVSDMTGNLVGTSYQ